MNVMFPDAITTQEGRPRFVMVAPTHAPRRELGWLPAGEQGEILVCLPLELWAPAVSRSLRQQRGRRAGQSEEVVARWGRVERQAMALRWSTLQGPPCPAPAAAERSGVPTVSWRWLAPHCSTSTSTAPTWLPACCHGCQPNGPPARRGIDRRPASLYGPEAWASLAEFTSLRLEAWPARQCLVSLHLLTCTCPSNR